MNTQRHSHELEVGSRLESRGRTITEADLVSFSALTGDWHPQHSDAAWAAESRFGERIAHGMLILSYSIGMLGLDPDRVVALRSIRDVVFKRPAPIGTTIRAEAEVSDVEPIDAELGLVRLALKIRDQDRALLARARAEIVWRGAEAVPDEPAVQASNGGAVSRRSAPNGAEPDGDALSPVRDGMVLT